MSIKGGQINYFLFIQCYTAIKKIKHVLSIPVWKNLIISLGEKNKVQNRVYSTLPFEENREKSHL